MGNLREFFRSLPRRWFFQVCVMCAVVAAGRDFFFNSQSLGFIFIQTIAYLVIGVIFCGVFQFVKSLKRHDKE